MVQVLDIRCRWVDITSVNFESLRWKAHKRDDFPVYGASFAISSFLPSPICFSASPSPLLYIPDMGAQEVDGPTPPCSVLVLVGPAAHAHGPGGDGRTKFSNGVGVHREEIRFINYVPAGPSRYAIETSRSQR